MDLGLTGELLTTQDGVVSRAQLVSLGATPTDLRRWLRRREMVTVHPGVYAGHTGPLSWSARAWAAVLLHWPAALSHQSALEEDGEVIHVAVDASRKPTPREGIRVHRLQGFEDRVRWNLGPPRLRLEDALLAVAASGTRTQALARATDECRGRRTTPARLATELDRHPRLRHRRWLLEALDDVAAGVQSPLEAAYVRRVERAHGLPRGQRQHRERTGRRVVYRDVYYEEFGVVVELDGRMGHEVGRDRWDDMDRDLELATTDRITLRLGWRHAEDDPCRTARRVAAVLRLRGWTGFPRCCGRECPITVRVGATG